MPPSEVKERGPAETRGAELPLVDTPRRVRVLAPRRLVGCTLLKEKDTTFGEVSKELGSAGLEEGAAPSLPARLPR